MAARPCDRHPQAVKHAGHCPACLIEAALSQPDANVDTAGDPSPAPRTLTVCLPLGSTAHASVLLVRDEGPQGSLLRLKIWHTPAADGFMERFRELQLGLDRWRGAPVSLPVAATVDAAGCPAVLSEFSQGVPLIDAVRSGNVGPSRSGTILREIARGVRSAHAAGLVHGSIVCGNVLVKSDSWLLLDFGMTSLLNPVRGQLAMVRADRLGLAALTRTLRGLCPRSDHHDPTL